MHLAHAAILGAMVGSLALGCASLLAAPLHHHHHRCRTCGVPYFSGVADEDGVPGAMPGGGYGERYDPYGGIDREDIPFQWDDGRAAPPGNAPYPQGFALTVPVDPKHPAKPAAGPLSRYVEVAAALGACWSSDLAPGAWSDATLRLSFRRDGAVNGTPRVVHVSNAADARTDSDVRRSLLAALAHCAPLHFSPSLGNAIAGQIFAIRFVPTRNS